MDVCLHALILGTSTVSVLADDNTARATLVEIKENSIICRLLDPVDESSADVDTLRLSQNLGINGCTREGLKRDVEMLLSLSFDEAGDATVETISVETCEPQTTFIGRILDVDGSMVRLLVNRFNTAYAFGDTLSIVLKDGFSLGNCNGTPSTVDELEAGRLVYSTGTRTDERTILSNEVVFSDNCTTTGTLLGVVLTNESGLIVLNDFDGLSKSVKVSSDEEDIQVATVSSCSDAIVSIDDIKTGDTVRVDVVIAPGEPIEAANIVVVNNCPDGARFLRDGQLIQGTFLEESAGSLTIRTSNGRLLTLPIQEDALLVDCANVAIVPAEVARNTNVRVITRPDERSTQTVRSVVFETDCGRVDAANGLALSGTETELVVKLSASNTAQIFAVNAQSNIIDCAGRNRSASDPDLVGKNVLLSVITPNDVPTVVSANAQVDCGAEVTAKSAFIVSVTDDTLQASVIDTREVLTLARPDIVTVVDENGQPIDWNDLRPDAKACISIAAIRNTVVALFIEQGVACGSADEEQIPIRIVMEGTVRGVQGDLMSIDSEVSRVNVRTNDNTQIEIPIGLIQPGTRVRITSSSRSTVFEPVADMVEILGSTPTSVEEINVNDVRVWPIPARDVITVQGNVQRLDLHAIDGSRVVGQTGQQLDISSVPSGMYMLRVVQEDGSTRTILIPVL